jgi:NAD+ synthase (glutamine-hydrolysing)
MPRYALAQINVTVGDLAGNAARILQALAQAARFEPDIVIFPELTLAGYPPEDLLLKPGFIDRCREVFEQTAAQVEGTALIGYPARDENGKIRNAAALVRDGFVETIYYKNLLPNYSVFDEERYFTPGNSGCVFDVGGQTAGVVICEDAWEDHGPARDEAAAGARVILCLSASPYHCGKNLVREKTFSSLCTKNDAWFFYCNLVGGQDDLVFDGGSLVMNPAGEVVARGAEFAEDMLVFDLPLLPKKLAGAGESACASCSGCKCKSVPVEPEKKPLPERKVEKLGENAEIYGALVLGVGDYVRKNGFKGVLVGLSGGIDSALTAAIAVDALGAENVIGVTLPSRYSSGETKSDAEILARNLGIRFESLPIEKPHTAFSKMLEPLFAGAQGDPENLTDQNLQARLRAVFLMALSNKYGMLVLNTSNKSECAVGYGTLYGDMVGGYAALKDVFKTRVWELSRYVNEKHGREVIPVSTIERVPSAELRPDQEDRQSLPDYPLLDPVLELYIEHDLSLAEIVARGHDPEVVRKIITLCDRSEFKRRQAVMGVRVTPKAFGKDRRLPVTNRFRP